MRAILKCKDHPSILAVQNNCKNPITFPFEEMDLANIEKEIQNLKINKASQNSDIPTKLQRKMLTYLQNFYGKA